MKQNFIKKILFSLVLVLALSGCSTKESESDLVEFTDAMGTVEIPSQPTRIVALTNEATEALLTLGITPVGAVNSQLGDPYYDYYDGKLAGVTPVGYEGDPNLETVASLNPDLIIGNKMRDEDNYTQLQKIAPTVFSETIRGNFKENFSLYAKAVGYEDKANQILEDYNKRIDSIHNLLESKGVLDKEVTVVRFMEGKTRLYMENSFTGTIFKDLGIKETTVDGDEDFAIEITKEQLADYAGDAIVYFTFISNDSDGAKDQEDSYMNDPLIQSLAAVKANQVYKVDDIIWNTGGGIICANLVLDQIEEYANEL